MHGALQRRECRAEPYPEEQGIQRLEWGSTGKAKGEDYAVESPQVHFRVSSRVLKALRWDVKDEREVT